MTTADEPTTPVRMYQERRRDFPGESALAARRRVGELLDIDPGTLRGRVERVEIDAGPSPAIHRWCGEGAA